MISQLQREALLDVIERCAWLIEYYGRTDAAPQSLDALKATMQQAVNDLEALPPSIHVESRQSSEQTRGVDSIATNK